MADESYDLVFIDADPVDQPRVRHRGRATAPVRAAPSLSTAPLLGGRAGDRERHTIAEVVAVREAARLIAEDERLTPVLWCRWGDGLLAAARD